MAQALNGGDTALLGLVRWQSEKLEFTDALLLTI